MPRVNVKGVSNPIDFPDDMDIEDIKAFLQKRFAGMAARGESTADVSPRQATAQAVNPSLGDKFSQGISDTLYDSGIVSDRYGAQRIGDNLGMIGEVLPGIGDATAGDEFGTALGKGDGVGVALGALGAIPLVGDAAKVVRAKVSRIGDSDLRPLFSEDNRLTNINPSGGMANAIFNENPITNLSGDVKVYRATIGDELRPNDFVAINKDIADAHLESLLERGEKGNLIEATVSADDLMMGNDATEFIFTPKTPQTSLSVGDGNVLGGIINNTNEVLNNELTRKASETAVADSGRIRGGIGFLDEQGREVAQLGRSAEGNLAGLPTNVKGFTPRHNVRIANVAKNYIEKKGGVYAPSTEYAKINPQNSAHIADEFEAMAHNPSDPEVQEAYSEMIKEVKEQYQAALDDGLQVEFIDFAKQGDPYAKSPRMANDDIDKNNHMYTFSTTDGFGSDDTFDVADNPLLQETGFMISGKPALANDLFRVVHDYFGHAKEGVGFRAAGEENAWRAHSSMFSPKARRAMTSETRGQNSWVNYGKFGERNRTALTEDTVFADQKIGLLPQWVSDGKPKPD